MFAAGLLVGGEADLNNAGIWSNDTDGLVLVARSGSQAAGMPAGTTYGSFFAAAPLVDDAGRVAFNAHFVDGAAGSTRGYGIWFGAAADPSLIVRSGSHAPGTPAGVNFSYLGALSLNDAGQLMIVGILTGPGVDATNEAGFWVADGPGDIRLVVRYGDLLEVLPGDFRTVEEVTLIGISGTGDGRPSAFNDLGQFAFRASFTDGSEGIFVSNLAVPEPGGLAILGLALPTLLRRRSR